MSNRWTKEEVEFLKNNYGAMSAKEIANIIGKTESSVTKKAMRENISAGKEWTDEEIEFLKKNYKDMTYRELSRHLNRTKTAIDLKINRLGLKKSKYTYNKDFFESIDCEEKAYWLGFIFADGCVMVYENNSCELSIKLQASDISHLKLFNKSINGNIECTTFTRECNLNNKLYSGCQIRVYSEKMVNDLIKHGVVPNKSLVKEFPRHIDKNLLPHFIRGYFDGNGCIVKTQSRIRCDFTCGSKNFIDSLREVLYNYKINTYITYNDKNTYRLYVSGTDDNIRFIDLLYKNSNLCLQRKYNKKERIYKELRLG